MRLTVAQAVVAFPASRWTERGGVEQTDSLSPVPSSVSWWDVPVAEVSELDSTRTARTAYENAKHVSACTSRREL